MVKFEYVLGNTQQTLWPDLETLKHHYEDAFDAAKPTTGGLVVDGLHRTDHLSESRNRVRATLSFTIVPSVGISLTHRLWDGRAQTNHSYDSISDLTKLREFVVLQDGTKLPRGLFIARADGWLALSEFVGKDGSRAAGANWIRSSELPPGLFPEPGSPEPKRWQRRM